MQSRTYGATKTTYGYDANDRVNSIVHAKTSDNSALHQEWYSYDPANNLTQKIVNSVGTSYTYDEIDQLKTENGGGLANTYNYDHNGNRSSRISSTGTDTYLYDDADKLMSVTRPNGTTTYIYDDCGRPTNIGSRTLTWDYEDRLTNLTGSGVPSTNYGYNGLGTRTTKSNTNGTRTYKRDGVGVTAPVLADGVSTMVPGISEKSGGQTNYLHTDRLGSMKGISNSANVTDTADYDAFGKVIAHTGSLGTQKGFASGFGYQEDGESAYKLLGHRYYDADTGRFLSRDPIGSGRNWYAYCSNNPLKAIDAEGLKPKLLVVVGATFFPTYFGVNVINSWIQLMLADIYSRYGLIYDIEVLYAPTREELMTKLLDADGFIFLGHGNSGALVLGTRGGPANATDLDPSTNGGYRYLTSSDIKKVAVRRARLGKGQLSVLELYSCNTCGSEEWVNAWFGVAGFMIGYDTGTIDGLPKIFIPQDPKINLPVNTPKRGKG